MVESEISNEERKIHQGISGASRRMLVLGRIADIWMGDDNTTEHRTKQARNQRNGAEQFFND